MKKQNPKEVIKEGIVGSIPMRVMDALTDGNIAYFNHMVINDSDSDIIYEDEKWKVSMTVADTGGLVTVAAQCKLAGIRASRILWSTTATSAVDVTNDIESVNAETDFTVASITRGDIEQHTAVAMLSLIGSPEGSLCLEATIHGNDSDECTICVKGMYM